MEYHRGWHCRYSRWGSLPSYAANLVQGVEAHKTEIDQKLGAASENWTLERMPIVDRAIMRMAVFEMLYQDDVPVSVSINEAVELAKEFGGEDDSARFANGILGRIARADEEGVAEEGAPADDAADDAAVTADSPAADDAAGAVDSPAADASSAPVVAEADASTVQSVAKDADVE